MVCTADVHFINSTGQTVKLKMCADPRCTAFAVSGAIQDKGSLDLTWSSLKAPDIYSKVVLYVVRPDDSYNNVLASAIARVDKNRGSLTDNGGRKFPFELKGCSGQMWSDCSLQTHKID